MATQAELEAAVAALPAKKRRLREAFDRLVACSPVPVPFRWEDLDAHLASIAASFGCHFDSLHAAADEAAAGFAAAAAADPITPDDCHVEPLEKEELLQQDRARHGDWEEGQDRDAEEGAEAEGASLDLEHAEEGKVSEESSLGLGPDRGGDKAVDEGVAIEASPEHDDEEDATAGPVVASRRRGNEVIEMVVVEEEEAVNASADHEGRDGEAEEGEWPHPHTAAVGSGETPLTRAVAAACANMDHSALADVLRLRRRSSLRARRAFLPALLGAADPHALLVRAVGGFLASTGLGATRCWGSCLALIECVPRLPAPSPDALEQAERLVQHWKEMLAAEPVRCRDMGRKARWGLLTFISSYNIVPEFSADEIIRLFGNIAPNTKNNCVDLCKRLGLIEKINDSINHFIENGQPLDAITLACTFNMTDKYPPLTILNDYVENAKKTAEDILSKENYTVESLNEAMAKKVDALMFSWSAVDGCNIDPVQRNAIKAEITQLLHKYANKQQSLAGVAATFSRFHQQHNFQKLQKETEDKQQHQQQMTREVEHQHIQNQQEPKEHERGWMWQNQRGKRPNNKNRKRKQWRQKQQQLNKRPRLSPYRRQEIHNQRGQPFSALRRAPFSACTRARYFGHAPVFHH